MRGFKPDVVTPGQNLTDPPETLSYREERKKNLERRKGEKKKEKKKKNTAVVLLEQYRFANEIWMHQVSARVSASTSFPRVRVKGNNET